MYENREYYITCDGIDLHAKLDFPKNQQEVMPLLIVIPGLTGHMEEEHIIEVARIANEIGLASLRVELYGHGKSGGEFFDHNVMLWMIEAMRVIDHARSLPFVSDIYLSGHSQGGLTAVLAAGLKSESIKALIPLSPAINIWDGARNGELFGVPFNLKTMPEEFGMDDWTLSTNYLRVARMLPVEDAVKLYRGPVLIIHGTDDESVPYRYGEQLAAQYENAKLVSIEDEDHCYTRHLQQVTDALRTFLLQQIAG